MAQDPAQNLITAFPLQEEEGEGGGGCGVLGVALETEAAEYRAACWRRRLLRRIVFFIDTRVGGCGALGVALETEAVEYWEYQAGASSVSELRGSLRREPPPHGARRSCY